MITQNSDIFKSNRTSALIAGISLILMAIVAGFSYGYVFQSLVDKTDSAATIKNIKSSMGLFRVGVFGFLVILFLDLIVSWGLYNFFERINKEVSLLTAWTRLIYTAFFGVAIFQLIPVYTMQSHPSMINVEILDKIILQNILNFESIWAASLILFGIHLILLSILIFKSGNIHKIFGYAMLIAGLCYIFANSADVLSAGYTTHKEMIDNILALPMALGELAFAFWLIFKGGKKNPS